MSSKRKNELRFSICYDDEDQGPRDDICSIIHVFIDLICGKLPWSEAARLIDKAAVGNLKRKYYDNLDDFIQWIKTQVNNNKLYRISPLQSFFIFLNNIRIHLNVECDRNFLLLYLLGFWLNLNLRHSNHKKHTATASTTTIATSNPMTLLADCFSITYGPNNATTSSSSSSSSSSSPSSSASSSANHHVKNITKKRF